jgi:hypothetical protein
VPPPVVAEMLGYSDQIVHRHAALAAQPWSTYSGLGWSTGGRDLS